MAKMWIVIGDVPSGGGGVLTGSPFTAINGIPVARISDTAVCLFHQGIYPIIDGDPTTIIDGQPVAWHGSSLACGCKVMSANQMRVSG